VNRICIFGLVGVIAGATLGCASEDPSSAPAFQSEEAALRAGDGAGPADPTALAIEVQRVRLFKAASPAAYARVGALAPALLRALGREDAEDPFRAAAELSRASYRGRGGPILGSLSGSDIEALAFLVLMEASKSAQEDLKAIMAGVKSINNAKAAHRAVLEKLQRDSAAWADTPDGGQHAPPLDGCLAHLDQCLGAPFEPEDATARLYFARATRGLRDAPPSTLADLDAQIDKMKQYVDTMSEMGEMESLRLQMAMDRMSKMMSTLSNLLKKISDTSSQIVGNLK